MASISANKDLTKEEKTEVRRTLGIIKFTQDRTGRSIREEVTRVERLNEAKRQLESIVGPEEAQRRIGQLTDPEEGTWHP